MQQVDALRKEADQATDTYRAALRYSESDLQFDQNRLRQTKYEKDQAETAVLIALSARWNCPPCPFKCGGIVIPTTTEGRLECEKCGATCLKGHRP